MRIVGVVIGALMIGGAVIALTGSASASPTTPDPVPGCMDKDASNYDENATVDNGTCTFPDDSDAKKKYEEDLAQQEEDRKAAADKAVWDKIHSDCPGLYSGKTRTNWGLNHVMKLNKVGAYSCDVEQLRVQIYTDKKYYIKGEPVKIYVGKMFYYKDWNDDRWWRWYSAVVSPQGGGERLDFKLGVKDEYDDIVLKSYGTSLNGSSANALSPSLEGRANAGNYGTSSNGNRYYSWQVFTIDTNNLLITEPLGFSIRAKAHRGSQGAVCSGEINIEKTQDRAFTIYPSVCARPTTLSAESNTLNAEPNQLTEFSKQSYMSEWW